MMEIALLAKSINTLLADLDRHYNAAKKAIDAVRPDLAEATRQTQTAHSYLGELAVMIMRAESFFGIQQPPDVIHRINKIHQELHEIEFEISACNAVLAGAEVRDARSAKTTGKHASN